MQGGRLLLWASPRFLQSTWRVGWIYTVSGQFSKGDSWLCNLLCPEGHIPVEGLNHPRVGCEGVMRMLLYKNLTKLTAEYFYKNFCGNKLVATWTRASLNNLSFAVCRVLKKKSSCWPPFMIRLIDIISVEQADKRVTSYACIFLLSISYWESICHSWWVSGLEKWNLLMLKVSKTVQGVKCCCCEIAKVEKQAPGPWFYYQWQQR